MFWNQINRLLVFSAVLDASPERFVYRVFYIYKLRMACFVYVSNLNWFTTEHQLEMIFSNIAPLRRLKVLTDKV